MKEKKTMEKRTRLSEEMLEYVVGGSSCPFERNQTLLHDNGAGPRSQWDRVSFLEASEDGKSVYVAYLDRMVGGPAPIFDWVSMNELYPE